MSTLKVTNIQHPSAADPAIELDPVDGVVFSAASFDASAITSGVLDEARVPLAAGIGSNVVQTVKTDVFALTSTSFTNIPDFEVKITPSSADSRVLLIAHIVTGIEAGGTGPQLVFTGGNTAGFIGDASGSRSRLSFSNVVGTSGGTGLNPVNASYTVSAVFLDAPNTASEVTYNVQARVPFGTGYINRAASDLSESANTPSTFTAIEVAA